MASSGPACQAATGPARQHSTTRQHRPAPGARSAGQQQAQELWTSQHAMVRANIGSVLYVVPLHISPQRMQQLQRVLSPATQGRVVRVLLCAFTAVAHLNAPAADCAVCACTTQFAAHTCCCQQHVLIIDTKPWATALHVAASW
jgi:hypothetical protein